MSVASNEEAVYSALEIVKGVARSVPPTSSLTRDLGLESLDVVDLFFEIEQSTGVVIELNQIMGEMRGKSGRRFEDLTIQDLINHLNEHEK